MASAPRLAPLSPGKRRLLGRLLAEQGLAAPAPAAIPRRSDLYAAPLSPAQRRLWLIDRLEPGSAAYNLPGAMRLEGDLRPGALRAALAEVVRRHEVLRTTFGEADGEPFQLVSPAAGVELPAVDLAGLPTQAREREATRLAQCEARRPFDLTRGPVLRACLLRLGERKHLLLWTLHHIAADGWSVAILVRELGALYRAFLAGEPSPLPEPPIQYADFALWQRRTEDGGGRDEQLAYWRERLAGLPPLDLPTDHPRPAGRELRGARLPLSLPAGLALALRWHAAKMGATPFMLLLAGFQALLSRCSGAEDLAVGTPVANRERREVEGLIGCFVNTLVLRGDLAGDPGFGELAARARETCLAAYAHQGVPFERLVEALEAPRDLGRNPLFQVMLVLQNTPVATVELAGLKLHPLELGTGVARFDLTLELEEREREIAGSLEYAADLFDAPTAARLAAGFEALLAGGLAEPARRLSEIPLLGAAEHHQVLVEWSGDGGEPEPGCLHELFAAQAKRTPDAVAVLGKERGRDAALTYRELAQRMERLACRLRRLGVGPEVPVGVCLGRTPELPAALLGVLAAGGAYLPLDPAYPRERLAFMVEDCAPRVLLTEERFLDLLAGLPGERLCIGDTEDGAGESETGPAAAPGNLAYFIYTSGSTGRPKGVAIEHRSAHALLAWAAQAYSAAETAAVLAATSICFDLSVFEIFLPLSRGGAVVLADNALELPSLPSACAVTLVNTVPSAAAELVAREGGIPASVRTVNLAGEPLAPALADALYRAGVARVCDLYGPSETTTYSTFARRDAGGAATIGRPIAGTRAYLLDSRLQPVPIGARGEICLGGAGLARGYAGRAADTAARFLPDPFGDRPGDRLYRTGDLARHRPDGSLELLGRIDQQVKVRGFRIEPGEVETALRAHPAVRAAAVLAVAVPGGKELAACVVADGEAPPDARRLRDFLREHLPAFMIPTRWLFPSALPLTPSGKTDLRALASAVREAEDGDRAEAGFGGPRTPLEELVAGICADLLGRGQIGVHDDFFALGGHSLLAARVLARLRQATGVELALRAAFEAPTAAALAGRVAEVLRGDAAPEAPIPRAPELPEMPEDTEPLLSFAQQRLWFLDRWEPGTALYNVPGGLRLRGPLLVPALERALREVVRRHEALRTVVAPGDGRPRQRILPTPPFPLPVVDLSALPGEERVEAELLRLAGEEARRPFDLEQGPLFRARLLRAGSRDHALLLNAHHIVCDGWSIGVLLRDLGELYAAGAAGRPAQLPELSLRYADFAVWQRGRLQGEVLDRLLAYWRERLAGLAPLALPADRPRPPVPGHRGASLPLALPPGLAADLRAFCRREGVTVFMALLAGFQALLARWARQDDVAVGVPTAGRERAETEDVVGLFVNTLVLRTDLAAGSAVRALLGRVREAVLAAHAHQDLPFERLVEELSEGRDASRAPLFQAAFAFQNTPGSLPALPGLTAEPLEVSTGTAKFDLTLTLGEEDGPSVPGIPGIRGALEYNRDLFEAATAGRFLACFQTLVAGLAAAPERPVAELPLLRPEERAELIATSLPQAAPRGGPCLHERFAAQVRRTPGAVALVCEDERLTYAELDARSNRLARRLRRHGVGPEVTVGLAAGRSAGMVAGILAILKAGGAYVPLDPTYPPERLALLLADCGAAVLLAEPGALPALPEADPPVPVVPLADAPEEESAPLPAGTSGASLAYVIYTSGSTGRPKGVQVTHDNVGRLFDATRRWFGFGPGDAWTLFHSYAFDFSVWEIWGALLHGGRLVVVPYRVSRSPEAFRALLARERITVLNQTPSAFRQLARADETAGGALALRLVIFGGEALDLASLRPWVERRGDQRPRLVNMYGITETTVHVTWRLVTAADVATAVGSPIGEPIPDLGLHVLDGGLDAGLEPAPAGVPGEMYVGGAGLARGYLGRPGLTAERFVPDPFGAPGGRLYRTGDLARRRPGGGLDYLGRADLQVKVRGFRIEPGEVESAIGACPGVREAAVVLGEAPAGERRLAAFWVPAPPPARSPDDGELRRRLAAALPEHMLPAVLQRLEALPLTAHGKVDRRALQELAARLASPESGRERAPAATATEKLLAGIWAEVLGLGEAGADDDFFALGGDSIRSLQVQAKARERGLAVSLQQLFQHPTVRGLARALDAEPGATPADPAAGMVATVATVAPFSLLRPEDRAALPAGVEDAYPLARLQAGMLFHRGDRSGLPLYHNVNTLRLRGPFDAGALRAAVAALAARHPVLRTAFDLGGFSEPLQLVHERAAVEIAIEDLRPLPPEARREALEAAFAAEVARPFDESRPGLIRFAAHRLEDDIFELTVTEHHAILDGWSVALLQAELLQDYLRRLGGAGGPAAPLPAGAASFRGFVAREREALESAAARRFWHDTLAGREPARLPRWPEAAGGGGAGMRVEVAVFPDAALAGLRELARAAAVPLKSVLLAAHARVMALLAGRSEVIAGVVGHGREEAADGDRVLGLFLNSLPLPLETAAGTWRDLARRVFAAEAAALPHRRFPLQEIQRELGGEPLFEALFNFVHFHAFEPLLRLGALEPLAERRFAPNSFPLAADFGLDPVSGRLGLALSWNAADLRPGQAAAITGLYTRALEAMAADPEGSPGELSPLSPAERQLVLVEWNATAAAIPEGRCLHDLFAARARQSPDAVAAVHPGGELTYGELDGQANRLARRLRSLGVGPEVLVGVCLERTSELLTVLLAIFKAGGAYLPVDPSHPPARSRDVLADAGVRLLLDRAFLDDSAGATASRSTGLLPPLAEPEHLAYVLYTSGSTGRPKGTGIVHRGLLNYLLWCARTYPTGGGRSVPLYSSIAFDLSVTSLFLPLLTGDRVVLVPEDGPAGVPALAAALTRRAGWGFVKLTPAHLALLEEELPARPAPAPRSWPEALILGGEQLLAGAIAPWRERAPRTAVFNEYGPTETVVGCCVHRTFPEDADEEGAVPIGRPIANTRLYVLDHGLMPVPVGVAGELYIGGAGLGRGYLRRPELTAELFVPDPFAALAGEPGGRLYRSGDLARHRPDGTLEYLGRIDDQVKIRGFRVEPGEVEAALAACPGVREAAVVAHGTAEDRRLVAYVCAASPTPGAAALRDFLRERLPEAMVPAVFVQLDALPVTPGGKVDRRALARTAPSPPAPETAAPPSPPRNAVEARIAELWAEVLGAGQVGVHDDFFALGGHSLAAARLASRLGRRLALAFTARDILENPTVAALARLAPERRGAVPAVIPPAPRAARHPLSHAQRRLWLIDRLEGPSPVYNVPGACAFPGGVDEALLADCLRALVERHEALRTRFVEIDDEPWQVIDGASGFRLDAVDLTAGGPLAADAADAADVAAGRLAREEAERPFDLAAEPPFRARLLRLPAGRRVLLFTLHHIVCDGWSVQILRHELGALYAAGAQGRPSPLPPLRLQYRDYAVWERGRDFEPEERYWLSRLAGVPELVRLPYDLTPPEVFDFRGGTASALLDEAVSRAVRETGAAHGTTASNVILAVFFVFLHRLTEQSDLAVAVSAANRNHPDLEPLVGFFVNELVIRLRIAAEADFSAVLREVTESTFEALEHSAYPFDLLVEKLAPPRRGNRQPLFNVCYSFQSFAGLAGVLEAGAGPEPDGDLGQAGTTAKFDLTLFVSDRGDCFQLTFEYSAELFRADSIRRYLGVLERFLTAVVTTGRS